jgi:hypothetical protein
MAESGEEPRLRNERTVPLNVPIPSQLRDRLDEIVRELDLAGAEPTLYGVVSMLILHAEEDRAKLFALWNEYRNALPEAAAARCGSSITITQWPITGSTPTWTSASSPVRKMRPPDPLARAKRAAVAKRRSEDAYRAALAAAHAAGHSFAEIAAAVGVSRQAVRQLLGR